MVKATLKIQRHESQLLTWPPPGQLIVIEKASAYLRTCELHHTVLFSEESFLLDSAMCLIAPVMSD